MAALNNYPNLSQRAVQVNGDRLKQPTTFKELMGQFIAFLAIAGTASYHDVRRVIGTATRQGDYVVNLIVFSNLLLTIITLTLLISTLSFYISSSKMSLCLMVNSTTPDNISTAICSPGISLSPLFITFLDSLLMPLVLGSPPLLGFFGMSFNVLLTSLLIGFATISLTVSFFPGFHDFWVLFSIPLIICQDFCSYFWIAICSPFLLTGTPFAFGRKLIGFLPMTGKEFGSSIKKLTTGACTLLAGYAVLRYYVHTDELTFIRHGSGVLQHSLSYNIFGYYNIKWLGKQV